MRLRFAAKLQPFQPLLMDAGAEVAAYEVVDEYESQQYRQDPLKAGVVILERIGKHVHCFSPSATRDCMHVAKQGVVPIWQENVVRKTTQF